MNSLKRQLVLLIEVFPTTHSNNGPLACSATEQSEHSVNITDNCYYLILHLPTRCRCYVIFCPLMNHW